MTTPSPLATAIAGKPKTWRPLEQQLAVELAQQIVRLHPKSIEVMPSTLSDDMCPTIQRRLAPLIDKVEKQEKEIERLEEEISRLHAYYYDPILDSP